VEGIRHVLDYIEPFVHAYGAAAVFVILALESLGAPLPGETLLIFASVMASRGELSLPALIVSAWAGSVLGDNCGYLIGRTLGKRTLARYGAKVGLTAERLGKVEAVFARYGPVTVAFARFVNVLRQLNGIVAGSLGMHWWTFLLFNAIGAAIWVSAWTLGSYYFGAHAADFLHRFGLAGGILAAAALAVAVAVVWFIKRRRG